MNDKLKGTEFLDGEDLSPTTADDAMIDAAMADAFWRQICSGRSAFGGSAATWLNELLSKGPKQL